ncbi:winged helix-turn-helix transcriptional regulator [Micromonospora musae]|uniref:winged helix-turn-helix transcriptional regulator n=1 Tax=Micromonospora musae TaxID=1894970 RepID=UPI0033F70173
MGEWWTLLILHDASDGYTRFEQFQENLKISSSILTSRLRTLTGNGLLERRRAEGASRGASPRHPVPAAAAGGGAGRNRALRPASKSPTPMGSCSVTRPSHRLRPM